MADYAQRSDAEGRFWREDNRWARAGYSLTVVPSLSSSPADGKTVFFGGDGTVRSTASPVRLYVPKSGTLVAAYVTATAGTAGSAEDWTLYVHQTDSATDTAIATVSISAATRTWINTGLSIPVSRGDQLAIKSVNPTWATNPANVLFFGVLFIE